MTRPRGSGSVFRTDYKEGGARVESASWAIAFYDRRKGKTQREYGFPSEVAAEKALRARLVDMSRGRRVGPSVERLTFAAMAKLITDDYRVNGQDEDRLAISISHLKLTFGDARAVDITGDRVISYAASRLEEEAAPASVNRELAALKRMFKLATQAKGLSKDVVPHIAMLKEDNIRQGFFEDEQFQAVLAKIEAPELRRVITVAHVTGWRVPSEILTRQWRHVDLKAPGWLRLEPGEAKSDEGRVFPLDLDPRLRTALEDAKAANEWLKAKGKIVPWVFHRKGGERIASFRKVWLQACKAAGVPGRLLHDFRRTAARNLSRRGYPRELIMEVCGWETESMFGRYFIADERMILEAIEAEKRRTDTGTNPGTSVRKSAPGAPERGRRSR